MTWTRQIPIAMVLSMMLAEPVLAPELNILQYAITQGGLLAVVLVLLWAYRRDMARTFETKNDSIQVLTGLVRESTATMRESILAVQALTKTVDNLVGRRISHDER